MKALEVTRPPVSLDRQEDPLWRSAWLAPVLLHAASSWAAELPTVVVTAPLEGSELARDELPADIQTVTRENIRLRRPTSIAQLADSTLSGISINEAQSNPFQIDVSFRGFTASPLLGNPIGLSVFIDGVRVNESFGDTVFWDLIPVMAIARLDLIPGSNPVFGLNTLGGALSLRTRTGGDGEATGVVVSGGSFGRRNAEVVSGGSLGRWNGLAALNYHEEDGWREHSPSQVRQAFLKGGFTGERTTWHLSYLGADNSLTGNGLAPESLLDKQRDAVYTYPDRTEPRLDFLTLANQTTLSRDWTLSASAYWRDLAVTTFNGDAEFDDGETPDDSGDDAYAAENRATATRQRTAGGTLQVSGSVQVAGMQNDLTIGLAWDQGRARFTQSEQDAEFTQDRGTLGTGEFELDTWVRGTNRAFGVYAQDSLAITPDLQLTASMRFNRVTVELEDLSGEEEALNGSHRFERLNPAAGIAYSFSGNLTGYLGYNEGSRAPTAVELACADENAPCSLPVAFVADPPLDAVTAKTWEGGLRGRWRGADWRITAFTSRISKDILFTAVGGSQGFFANVEATRRRGLDTAISGRIGRFDWRASYSLVDATFATSARLFNPVASELDPHEPAAIEVRSGDRMPGIPRHSVTLTGEYLPVPALAIGADFRWSSDRFLRGDEDNSEAPLSGSSIANVRIRYQATESVRLFASVENVFDRRYQTLGARNRSAFDADGAPRTGTGPGPVERFLSPGPPRNFWLGLEYAFGGS